MRKLHHLLKGSILSTVDFFYPLCKAFMPLQTFRYAACGGANTAFNILLYFLLYNFVLDKLVLHLGPIAISAHIAAFLIAFCITFPTGFYLSMFVVFTGSHLRRRVQFIRYFLVAIACILINYVLLKLFVDVLGWYPTPSMILTTAIVIGFSYLSQRHFSFQQKVVSPTPASLSEAA